MYDKTHSISACLPKNKNKQQIIQNKQNNEKHLASLKETENKQNNNNITERLTVRTLPIKPQIDQIS